MPRAAWGVAVRMCRRFAHAQCYVPSCLGCPGILGPPILKLPVAKPAKDTFACVLHGREAGRRGLLLFGAQVGVGRNRAPGETSAPTHHSSDRLLRAATFGTPVEYIYL